MEKYILIIKRQDYQIKLKDYIGFVSQNIYITNDTLKSNIAFGFDDAEIDENKILECLKHAI